MSGEGGAHHKGADLVVQDGAAAAEGRRQGQDLEAGLDVHLGVGPLVLDVALAQHDVAVARAVGATLGGVGGAAGADLVQAVAPVVGADLGVEDAAEVLVRSEVERGTQLLFNGEVVILSFVEIPVRAAHAFDPPIASRGDLCGLGPGGKSPHHQQRKNKQFQS